MSTQPQGTTHFPLCTDEAGLPVDLLCDSLGPQSASQSKYASEIQQRLPPVFQRVRDKTNPQQLRQKSYYDRKVHEEKLHVKGQLVRFYHVNKDTVENSTGVGKVHTKLLKQLSDATYRIKHVSKKGKRQVVHFDRLKPCPSDVRLESEVIAGAEEIQEGDPGSIQGRTHYADKGDEED